MAAAGKKIEPVTGLPYCENGEINASNGRTAIHEAELFFSKYYLICAWKALNKRLT
jgi:hypothetical protein